MRCEAMPHISQRCAKPEARGFGGGAQRFGPEPALADIGIVVRYRKKRSSRFVAALDTATSVAPPPNEILNFYEWRVPGAEIVSGDDEPEGSGQTKSQIFASATAYERLTDEERGALEQLWAGRSTLEQALSFYNGVVARLGAFPLDWELPIVELSLQRATRPTRPPRTNGCASLRNRRDADDRAVSEVSSHHDRLQHGFDALSPH